MKTELTAQPITSMCEKFQNCSQFTVMELSATEAHSTHHDTLTSSATALLLNESISSNQTSKKATKVLVLYNSINGFPSFESTL